MPIFESVMGALDFLKSTLTMIGNTVRKWDYKKANIFLGWLETKLNYVKQENTYDPLKDNFYKRGEIVHVELGFNVGSEEGGGRFAVVLWAPQKSKTMTIIPITSEKPGSRHNPDIHVRLGELLEDGIVNWAKVEQIRCVSKLRVTYPAKSKNYKNTKLSPDQMDEIDKRIKRLYTKPTK